MGWDLGDLSFGLLLVLLAELQRWVQLGASVIKIRNCCGIGEARSAFHADGG